MYFSYKGHKEHVTLYVTFSYRIYHGVHELKMLPYNKNTGIQVASSEELRTWKHEIELTSIAMYSREDKLLIIWHLWYSFAFIVFKKAN